MAGYSGSLTSLEEFLAQCQSAPVVPVIFKQSADTETPISLLLKLGDEGDSFLLESAEGGERWARYSFIGRAPLMRFTARGDQVEFSVEGKIEHLSGSTPDCLAQVLARFACPPREDLPRLTCGLVGYFGYDFARYSEKLPSWERDTLNLPTCHLVAPGELAVLDHYKAQVYLIVNVLSHHGRTGYEKAVARLFQMRDTLAKPLAIPPATPAKVGEIAESMGREAYLAAVERAKHHIIEGDLFQIVLSQRLTADFEGDGLSLYRALRRVNPSPYMVYLNFPEVQVVGASPEMLLRLENGRLETCPIAGTRKRGENAQQDEALARELLADPKEMAEHRMLIDLARNDVGKVSDFGSVQVEAREQIALFSHVMHVTSTVTGQLREGFTAVDALCSLLPAGTLSGAPKVRAMEIIAQNEKLCRGIYGGAVGYLGFDGNADTCIAIRMAQLCGGQIHVQAGAGIVADSVPEREYAECNHKAQAIFTALKALEEEQ